MFSLNLPAFDAKIVVRDGKRSIFDVIRRRYVALTPEEWVRQHFIHFLIESKGYPARLIAVEKEIQVCGMKRRFDLVCYDRQAVPYLIVECKAPSVALSQAVFDQAFQYNLSIAARFIAITNGCLHFCGEISGGGKFQMLAEIPNFCG